TAAREAIDAIDPEVHPGRRRGQRTIQWKIQSPLELPPGDRERCAFALQVAERAHQANSTAALSNPRRRMLLLTPDFPRCIAHALFDQVDLRRLGQRMQGE